MREEYRPNPESTLVQSFVARQNLFVCLLTLYSFVALLYITFTLTFSLFSCILSLLTTLKWIPGDVRLTVNGHFFSAAPIAHLTLGHHPPPPANSSFFPFDNPNFDTLSTYYQLYSLLHPSGPGGFRSAFRRDYLPLVLSPSTPSSRLATTPGASYQRKSHAHTNPAQTNL